MKKILKIILFILLLLIVGAFVIPYFYKDKLIGYVKENINRNLNAVVDFQDADVSLFRDFPNFSVQLDEVSVQGVKRFQDICLMEADYVGLSFNIQSVLFGNQAVVKKIHIDSPQIDAWILKDGSSNFDIVKKDSLSTDTPKTDTSFAIQIKNYKILNANILYTDEATGITARLKNLDHRGSGKITDKQYLFSTKTLIDSLSLTYGNTRLIKNVRTRLASDIAISADFDTYTLNDTKLSFNELLLDVTGNIALKEESIDITYSTEKTGLKELLSLIPKAYMPDLKGVRTDGLVRLLGYIKGKSTDSEIPGFKMDILVDNCRLQYPDLPEDIENINAVAHIDFKGGKDLDDMRIAIPKIQFDIVDNPVNGNLKITRLLTDPSFYAHFKTLLNLQNLKKTVKLKGVTQLQGTLDTDFSIDGSLSALDKKQYDKIKANGYFNLKNFKYDSEAIDYDVQIPKASASIRPYELNIKELQAKIGDNDFAVEGNVLHYIAYIMGKDEVLKARFKNRSKFLNINSLMTEDVSSDTQTSEGTGVIKIPKNIDFTLMTQADKMLYKNMELQNVKGELRLKDEKAELSSVDMSLLGGDARIKGSYATHDSIAKATMTLRLEHLAINKSVENFESFQAFAPVLQGVAGNYFLNTDLSVDIDKQMNLLLNTLNASGHFKTDEISPKNIKVLDEIGAILKFQDLSNIKIDGLDASFKINDGRIKILPFNFKVNEMGASLQGNFDLNKKLDFILTLDVPREKLGSDINNILKNFTGALDQLNLNSSIGELIKMKFNITGTPANPKIKPIILGTKGGSITETATKIVKDKIEEVKNEALIKAQAEADKLLEMARVQKERLVAEAEKLAQKVRNEASTAADKLINEAGNDMLKQMGAKLAADKIKKEGDKKANHLVSVAEKEGDKLLQKATQQAESLLKKAKSEKQ